MEYLFFISEIQYDSTSSLTYPAALRGVAHKIGAEAKGKYISPSSPVSRSMAGCFCAAKYRGEPRSMAMRRGLKKTLSRDNRGNPPLPLCS